MIRRQEEVLTKTEKDHVEMKQSLFDAKSEIERLCKSNESRDRQLKDAHDKLAESAKLLESNQQVQSMMAVCAANFKGFFSINTHIHDVICNYLLKVIAWLNREINEVQLGKSGGGNISSISGYGATSTRPVNSYPEAKSNFQTSFQPSMMYTPTANPGVNKNAVT